MKKVVLLLAVLMAFSGCSQNHAVAPVETTVPSPTVMVEDIYSPALSSLMAQPNISMRVLDESTMQIHGESFTTRQEKEIRYSPDAMQVTSAVEYGKHMLAVREVWVDGTVYQAIDQSNFQGLMPREEFVAMHIPADILHPEHYEEILLSYSPEGTQLLFTQPIAGEEWALPPDAALLSAQGSATLSPDGLLEQAQYTVSYCTNGSTTQRSVSVSYGSFSQEIRVPDGQYTQIDYLQGPLLAEKAYGYLLQTVNTDCTITKQVFSQADSSQYLNSVTVERAPAQYAVSSATTLSDPSLGLAGQEQTQYEEFSEGVYSITVNGERAEPRPGIDDQIMGQYCLDLLVSNIVSSRYFTGAAAEIVDGKCVITYLGGESLAEALCREGCKILYRDENFLDSQTDHFEDYRVTFTLTLDAETSLPESCCITFYGIHHVGGINYTLESNYSQTFSY